MPLAPFATFRGAPVKEQSGRGRRHSFNLPANVTYLQGTVVGELVGVNQVTTVTLGTQSSGTFTLTLLGQTTGTIAFNATAATVLAALQALTNLSGQSAVQTLTASANPTAGSYKLSFRGQQTTPLAYNAVAATVQAALQALSSIGSGNITVTGGPLSSGALTFTWGGNYARAPVPDLIEIDATFLTATAGTTFTVASVFPGGGPSVTSDVAVTGSAGGPYTVTFGGALGYQPVTLTGSFASLTTPGNASITTATAGSAGTQGTVKASLPGATDGSQFPVGVLEYDVSTDAAGTCFWGLSTASPDFAGRGRLSAPVYISGEFECQDLVGLDITFVQAPFGTGGPFRIIEGTVVNGRVVLSGN